MFAMSHSLSALCKNMTHFLVLILRLVYQINNTLCWIPRKIHTKNQHESLYQFLISSFEHINYVFKTEEQKVIQNNDSCQTAKIYFSHFQPIIAYVNSIQLKSYLLIANNAKKNKTNFLGFYVCPVTVFGISKSTSKK